MAPVHRPTDSGAVSARPERRPADGPIHPPTAARGVLHLQRQAGNRAVAGLIGRSSSVCPRATAVQRATVNLPSGGAVGDPPATNPREAVLLVLDRAHELWGIENDRYDAVCPAVQRLGPGQSVTDPAVLAAVRRAIARTLEPVITMEIARARGTPLSAGVGTGQPNAAPDVLALQDLLHQRRHLNGDDDTRERALVDGGGPRDAAGLPATYAGIVALKRTALAQTSRTGWNLIRSDEAGPAGPGGNDRLADRTFAYQDFLFFVPASRRSARIS